MQSPSEPGEELSVVPEVEPQASRDREDEMTLRGPIEDLFGDERPEGDLPLLEAGGAEALSLAGEANEQVVSAVPALPRSVTVRSVAVAVRVRPGGDARGRVFRVAQGSAVPGLRAVSTAGRLPHRTVHGG